MRRFGAVGRAGRARTAVPVSVNANFKPSYQMKKTMHFDFPKASKRQPVLTKIRDSKMARSSHAYVRGNTLKFYEWLDSTDLSALPEGPAIWICGDCHVGNLGPVADAQGQVEIQIRDFDQTVVGNPAHDLIRLGLSLATAVRSSNLPGTTTAKMMEKLVEGYEEAFKAAPDGVLDDDRPRPVDASLREALRRSWRHLAKDRIKGDAVTLPLGKRFWPTSATERRAIEKLFAADALHHLATLLRHRDDAASVQVLDAAYWMKGCSSLGLLRMAVLLDVDRSASRRNDMCLIDIKEAIKAAAPRYSSAPMPRDNAQRIVAGAQALSPSLGERMVATSLLGRAVFVRELLPQDLKLEIDQLAPAEALSVAFYLAKVVGRAHSRQMDAATRMHWQKILKANRSRTLDAPSWLWSSVVELVASHERGYLEHCRLHALSEAA